MTMKWSNAFILGLDLIDSQHKELCGRAGLLVEAMQQGKGDEAVRLITSLEIYAHEHFSAEEELMCLVPGQNFRPHIAQHQVFRRALANLKMRSAAKGPSSSLVLCLQQTLWDWLKSHILITDRRFAEGFQRQAAGR